MSKLAAMKKVLVVAPHPDDEILGCGGTMARLVAEGADVHVVIMTSGQPPEYSEAYTRNIRAELATAHQMLGLGNVHFLDLPAAGLDKLPAAQVNKAFGDLAEKLLPDTMFLPFVGDIHLDHQVSFLAAMVAARPRKFEVPARIYAYETLSETNWYAPGITPAFIPNMYVDISDYLDKKIEAFLQFKSQVKEFPDERSPETLRALATLRGSTVYRMAAEAFMLVREIA
ncbi:MAG: PIG-L deacetylase family protein [Sphingorhabdus sp.]